MATQGYITIEELTDCLKDGLPVLEVSEKSWRQYALMFASWLEYAGLVRPGQITSEVIRSRRSGAPGTTPYMPSVYIAELLREMEKVQRLGQAKRTEIDDKAVLDGIRLGILQFDRTDEHLELTERGQMFLSDINYRPKVVRSCLKSLPYVNQYLTLIEEAPKKHLDVLRSVISYVDLTEDTWNWRSKLLAHWLVFAGLATRKSGLIQKSHQPSLFDTSP